MKFRQRLGGDPADLLIRNAFQFLRNDFFAFFPCIGRGVVFQILLQGHDGVRLAAVRNLAGFHQFHKPVPGASFPVAGGAEAGDVAKFQKPVDDFVQTPVVVDVELRGVLFGGLLLHIAADAGAGTAADL